MEVGAGEPLPKRQKVTRPILQTTGTTLGGSIAETTIPRRGASTFDVLGIETQPEIVKIATQYRELKRQRVVRRERPSVFDNTIYISSERVNVINYLPIYTNDKQHEMSISTLRGEYIFTTSPALTRNLNLYVVLAIRRSGDETEGISRRFHYQYSGSTNTTTVVNASRNEGQDLVSIVAVALPASTVHSNIARVSPYMQNYNVKMYNGDSLELRYVITDPSQPDRILTESRIIKGGRSDRIEEAELNVGEAILYSTVRFVQ